MSWIYILQVNSDARGVTPLRLNGPWVEADAADFESVLSFHEDVTYCDQAASLLANRRLEQFVKTNYITSRN